MTKLDVSTPLEAAQALLGRPVRDMSLSASGANSRVIAIETGGQRYALKHYPDWRMTGAERCRAEWQSLVFLYEAGLTQVPKPIAHDPAQAILVLEWIDGVAVDSIGAPEMQQAVEFLAKISSLSQTPAALSFPLASEACLSGQEIVRQIERRLAAFTSDSRLTNFLSSRFAAAFDASVETAQRFYGYNAPLQADLRCLIPADFGFHNALRESGGRIRFFDFDYFGWDDPVKLTADFVLHPAMRLSADQKAEFIENMVLLRSADASFRPRLKAYLPLFALRWALILLNIFREDRRSAQAGGGPMDAQASGQLAKAEAFVESAQRLLA